MAAPPGLDNAVRLGNKISMKLPQIGFFSPSGEAECGVAGLRSQDTGTLQIKFSVDPHFYDFGVKAKHPETWENRQKHTKSGNYM